MADTLAAGRAAASVQRAELELLAGRLDLALALAADARIRYPAGAGAPAVIAAVGEAVRDALPAIDASRWTAAIEPVAGWLTVAEATLLARCVAGAPADSASTIVEIGSYRGRSTLLLALAVADLGLPLRVTAIDPHRGYHFGEGADTYDALLATLERHGVESVVDVVRAHSLDVRLSGALALAFIDGLHDAASVHADHAHVASRLVRHGLVAFHDYDALFPGVVAVVNELLFRDEYALAGLAGSLVVLRRRYRPSVPWTGSELKSPAPAGTHS